MLCPLVERRGGRGSLFEVGGRGLHDSDACPADGWGWATMPRGLSRTTARRAIKLAAGLTDAVRRPARGLVVLIYHRVGTGTSLEMDLPRSEFERQARRLAHGASVAAIDDALTVVENAGHEGPDPVVLTFDDGTADFVEHALPVLVPLGLPSTLYVATDFIESGREFPYGGRPLSWSALSDAVSTGLVTVGSHTHTHALLDRLDPRSVADELDRSIGLIEDRLGFTPRHFAYPKALLTNQASEPEVRRRFASAAIGGCRPNPYGRTDPHRLLRSPVQTSDGWRWFERKLAGGMAFEDDLRRVVNRWRYSGAST